MNVGFESWVLENDVDGILNYQLLAAVAANKNENWTQPMDNGETYCDAEWVPILILDYPYMDLSL